MADTEANTSGGGPAAPAAPAVKTELLKTLKLPAGVLSLDASADGGTLYAACIDGGIYEVSFETEQAVLLGKHDSYASGVAMLPDGSALISAGYDGVLQWHDLTEKRTARRVQAHDFWSWQMALSRDGALAATVTGQYLCGGYKYEPAPEREPSVKVFDARTGELRHSFAHAPPALSTGFSADGRFLAAGNLMGEVRVWDLAAGQEAARWTSPSYTSWGIIKGHYYTGGIYSLVFADEDQEVIACGMGPMRDPMAGNGKQTWERFAWRENPVRRVDEIHESEHGGGHPETLAMHPSRDLFAMGGRLAQGKWNVGLFDARTGALAHSLDVKNRVTKAVFSKDGQRLFLGITMKQERAKDGKAPDFGRIAIYSIS